MNRVLLYQYHRVTAEQIAASQLTDEAFTCYGDEMKNRSKEPDFELRFYSTILASGAATPLLELTRPELQRELARAYDVLGELLNADEAAAGAGKSLRAFMWEGE